MRKSRIASLFLALLGLMALLSSMSKPRVEALHGADILGLVASGVCFGVAFVGLIGRLRLRNE